MVKDDLTVFLMVKLRVSFRCTPSVNDHDGASGPKTPGSMAKAPRISQMAKLNKEIYISIHGVKP